MEPLVASLKGDVITVNGDEYDFGPLEEGDVLPSGAIDSQYFTSEVSRINGVIQLTLVLPHEFDAPESMTFPKPLDVGDGPVPIPVAPPKPIPAPAAVEEEGSLNALVQSIINSGVTPEEMSQALQQAMEEDQNGEH
jgi:hypothetical protein